MDQEITRAPAAPRLVGEFQGYIDGIEPSVTWTDRKNMPQVGDKLYALPSRAAVPRTWSILLTSANHGTVGPVGSTFPHAGDKHERVQVMEIVEAGAAAAPGTDLVGLVRIEVADMIDRLDDVHSWARGLPIPTPGTVTAMHNIRKVKEALGAAPIAAQAGQVAASEDGLRLALKTIRLMAYSAPQTAQWIAEAVHIADEALAAAPASPAVAQQAPAQAAPAASQITDTISARKFVDAWHRKHFPTDRTFSRYIMADPARSNPLAGDFAWQLAKALESLGFSAQASTSGERQEGSAT